MKIKNTIIFDDNISKKVIKAFKKLNKDTLTFEITHKGKKYYAVRVESEYCFLHILYDYKEGMLAVRNLGFKNKLCS